MSRTCCGPERASAAASVPPETLPRAFASYVVSSEQLAQRAAVRQPTDAVAVLGHLGDFEAAHPGALISIPYVDFGPRSERSPLTDVGGLPPAFGHAPHRIECCAP